MKSSLKTASLKKMLGYLYLVAYCPAEDLVELNQAASLLHRQAARISNLSEESFIAIAIPEACQRIVSYHQNSPDPDGELVAALVEDTNAVVSDASRQSALIFQERMSQVAELPARAKAANRLHRSRGCTLCRKPCHYGYFTLISDPDFKVLEEMLQVESQRPASEQRPLQVLWSFARYNLRQTLAANMDFITPAHLGNLAFCLYLLATAKSRYVYQEAPLRALQEINQNLIQKRI